MPVAETGHVRPAASLAGRTPLTPPHTVLLVVPRPQLMCTKELAPLPGGSSVLDPQTSRCYQQQVSCPDKAMYK